MTLRFTIIAILAMLFCAPTPTPIYTPEAFSPIKDAATIRVVCGDMIGTGTVVGGSTVLTASHVVNGSQTCRVERNGRALDLRVTENDPSNDFAVLRSSSSVFRETYVVNCDPFVSDQTYHLAGYAYGQTYTTEPLVAQNLYYDVAKASGVTTRLRAFTGDSANGMSGGPIVNDAGEVVGILSGSLKTEPRHVVGIELGGTSICRPK